jgi:hypothetical protein
MAANSSGCLAISLSRASASSGARASPRSTRSAARRSAAAWRRGPAETSRDHNRPKANGHPARPLGFLDLRAGQPICRARSDASATASSPGRHGLRDADAEPHPLVWRSGSGSCRSSHVRRRLAAAPASVATSRGGGPRGRIFGLGTSLVAVISAVIRLSPFFFLDGLGAWVNQISSRGEHDVPGRPPSRSRAGRSGRGPALPPASARPSCVPVTSGRLAPWLQASRCGTTRPRCAPTRAGLVPCAVEIAANLQARSPVDPTFGDTFRTLVSSVDPHAVLVDPTIRQWSPTNTHNEDPPLYLALRLRLRVQRFRLLAKDTRGSTEYITAMATGRCEVNESLQPRGWN